MKNAAILIIFVTFPKKMMFEMKKSRYSGSNHVYYKYYLNSSKCLIFTKY